MEVSGQLQAPAALSPENEPRFTLDRMLGGPQTRCGHGGEEKTPSLAGNGTLDFQLIAWPLDPEFIKCIILPTLLNCAALLRAELHVKSSDLVSRLFHTAVRYSRMFVNGESGGMWE